MKLIVGLGNPGKKYQGTRHNAGRLVVERLASQMTNGQWLMVKKLQSLIINHQPLMVLAKPMVFMNNSGVAIKKLVTNYRLPITNLWVIHDDVDLPLGKIKVQVGRGAAGHHGVESIINELGDQDFVRFRLGIGRPVGDSESRVADKQIDEFVLSNFSREEKVAAERMVVSAAEAIKLALKEGLEKAGLRYFKG